MQTEIWREIEDTIGYYLISNLGNVKSTRLQGIKRDLILKTTKSRGYDCLTLCTNGIRRQCTVHRLVAAAFIPNPHPELYNQINHINGIKSDNRVINLEWCTRSENIKHAFRIGLMKVSMGAVGRCGKLHGKSRPVGRYTLDGVLVKEYESMHLAAKDGFSAGNISNVCAGRIKHSKGFIFKYL